MNHPEAPNESLVKSYLEQWETLENYILQENSLGLLNNTLCPVSDFE